MPRKPVVSPAQDRLLVWLHVHEGDAFGPWTGEYEHLRPPQIHVSTLENLVTLGLIERRTAPGNATTWGLYDLTEAGRQRIALLITKGSVKLDAS